jgi:hypothetical protein
MAALEQKLQCSRRPHQYVGVRLNVASHGVGVAPQVRDDGLCCEKLAVAVGWAISGREGADKSSWGTRTHPS